MKVVIVGCGLSGITSAILLKERGHKVTIYESRSHIGGNCYDSKQDGMLIHNYGPHIFHTNDDEVFSFLSRYTKWKEFKLRPLGETPHGLISLPYSKKTQKEIGKALSQQEISDLIFKDYSEKQWGTSFDKIPKSITNRIPFTANLDNPTWFEGEKYQCIPVDGYTYMMENMLDGIDIKLGCEKSDWKKEKCDLLIYTGMIDEYFDHCLGSLPYRTLDFEIEKSKDKLSGFIINQNNSYNKYTRICDYSYINDQKFDYTIKIKEFPREFSLGDIPFYPVPFGDGPSTFQRYKELAILEKDVIFLGRLATYKYLDMWVTIKQAIQKINTIL